MAAAIEEEECKVFRPPNIPAERDHVPKLPLGRHDVYDNLAYPDIPEEGPSIRPNNFMGNLPNVERRYVEADKPDQTPHLDANENPLPIVKKRVSASCLYIEKEPLNTSTMTLVLTEDADTKESGPEVGLTMPEEGGRMNKVEPAGEEADQPPETAIDGTARAINGSRIARQTLMATADADAAAAANVNTKKEAKMRDFESFLEGTREPGAFHGVHVEDYDSYLEKCDEPEPAEVSKDDADHGLWGEVFCSAGGGGPNESIARRGQYISENEAETAPNSKPSIAKDVETVIQEIRETVDLAVSERAAKAAAAAAGAVKAAAAAAAASTAALDPTVTLRSLWRRIQTVLSLESWAEAEAKSIV